MELVDELMATHLVVLELSVPKQLVVRMNLDSMALFELLPELPSVALLRKLLIWIRSVYALQESYHFPELFQAYRGSISLLHEH